MNTDYPRKVNYSEYKDTLINYLLKSFAEGKISDFDTEKTRRMLYGYTFTEDYAKGVIPDILSIDYWQEINKEKHLSPAKLSLNEFLGQECLIFDAIKSTGNGTADMPYNVICVKHEYEFIMYDNPEPVKILKQRLLPGNIDCIEFETDGCVKSIYFDISHGVTTKLDHNLVNEAFKQEGWTVYHQFMAGNRYEKGNDVVTGYYGRFELNGKPISNEAICDMLHIDRRILEVCEAIAPHPINSKYGQAFLAGVKWADEHPVNKHGSELK